MMKLDSPKAKQRSKDQKKHMDAAGDIRYRKSTNGDTCSAQVACCDLVFVIWACCLLTDCWLPPRQLANPGEV